MASLILLVVGAAWMAVLLPPLMRSRLQGGSTSSVSEFRRQLNTLQRTQSPRRQAPMRPMVRPLVASPARRPAPAAPAGLRLVPAPGTTGRRSHHGAHAARRHDTPRHHLGAEEMFLHPREIVRRRRTNVLYALVSVAGISLFLAFTTGSTTMVYLFGVAALALVGYCYTLVQIRNQEYLRRYYRSHHAA